MVWNIARIFRNPLTENSKQLKLLNWRNFRRNIFNRALENFSRKNYFVKVIPENPLVFSFIFAMKNQMKAWNCHMELKQMQWSNFCCGVSSKLIILVCYVSCKSDLFYQSTVSRNNKHNKTRMSSVQKRKLNVSYKKSGNLSILLQELFWNYFCDNSHVVSCLIFATNFH